MTLDPGHPDRFGRPGLRLTYKDHPDDMMTKQWFRDRTQELMEAAGATRVWNQPVLPSDGGVHLLGTARMGNDPRDSVVDRYHRAHDVPNLFICDGQQLRDVRPRPADDDDSGARVPRGGSHREVQRRRSMDAGDLTTGDWGRNDSTTEPHILTQRTQRKTRRRRELQKFGELQFFENTGTAELWSAEPDEKRRRQSSVVSPQSIVIQMIDREPGDLLRIERAEDVE